MKQTLCLLAGLLLIAGCSPGNDAVISFNVSGPISRNIVLVYNTDVHEVVLDDSGKAVHVMEDADATYIRVYYGLGMKMVFAEKGDTPTISFAGNDFANTFTLEGKKASATDYLNTTTLTALPDETYALPFDEFLARTEEKVDEALKILQGKELSGAFSFRRIEKGRITYAYGATLLMYPMAHRIMAQNPDYIPDDNYYATVSLYFTEEPALADITEYREYMAECAHILDPQGRHISELYPKLVQEMRYLSSFCKNSKVRQALLHHIAIPYLDRFGIKDADEMCSLYLHYVTDPHKIASYEEVREKWENR